MKSLPRWTAFLTLLAAVAPIWIAPLPPTTDGHSHLYNAFIAEAVEHSEQPFGSYLRIQDGLGPNRTAGFILQALGPRLGWETAERVLLTLMVAGCLVAFVLLVKVPLTQPFAPLIPLAGWLAQSWFAWMGFYDFAWSAGLLAALLLALRAQPGWLKYAGIQLLFALLFLSHLFTFTIAIGLVASVLTWDAFAGRGKWSSLLILLPAVGLWAKDLSQRYGESAEVVWMGAGRALAGIFGGDFVASFEPSEIFVGVLLMGCVWATLFIRLRSGRTNGFASLHGAEPFALALLLMSLVTPDQMVAASYLAIRMRYLACLLLLPSMALVLSRGPLVLYRVVGGFCLVGLVLRGAQLTHEARRLDADLERIERLLVAAGAQRGAWIRTDAGETERLLFRIAAHRHLSDRAALRLGLVVLNNYEADLPYFPTKWRGSPDRLSFETEGNARSVSLTAGERRWWDKVLVIHESGCSLVTRDEHLVIGPAFRSGDFAVTTVEMVTQPVTSSQP